MFPGATAASERERGNQLTAPLQAASIFLGALNVSLFFFLQIFSSEER